VKGTNYEACHYAICFLNFIVLVQWSQQRAKLFAKYFWHYFFIYCWAYSQLMTSGHLWQHSSLAQLKSDKFRTLLSTIWNCVLSEEIFVKFIITALR